MSVHAFVADPFNVPKSSATCGADHFFAKNTCASKYSFDDAKAGCVHDQSASRQNAETHRYLNCVEKKLTELVALCISQYEQVATSCSQSYEEIELSVVEGKRRQAFIRPMESDLDAALDVHLRTSLTRLSEAQKTSQKSLEDITNRTGDLYKSEKEIKDRIAEMRKIVPAPEPEPPKEKEQAKNQKSTPSLADIAQYFSGKPAEPKELKTMTESQSFVRGSVESYAQNPAARAGNSKEGGSPAPLETNLDAPVAKKDFEKSKVGEIQQQPGMSGSLANSKVSTSPSTNAKVNPPSQAAHLRADAPVSEGSYSGGTGKYQVSNFGSGVNRWSVSQLRSKLDAQSRFRTPAQLRMQAGIASPHGDLFQKIKFRYNRLSSTLRP